MLKLPIFFLEGKLKLANSRNDRTTANAVFARKRVVGSILNPPFVHFEAKPRTLTRNLTHCITRKYMNKTFAMYGLMELCKLFAAFRPTPLPSLHTCPEIRFSGLATGGGPAVRVSLVNRFRLYFPRRSYKSRPRLWQQCHRGQTMSTVSWNLSPTFHRE